jgi:Flp pilus assembly pilin Flp
MLKATKLFLRHGLIPLRRVFGRKKSRTGQTMVEYALILAFISVVAISVLSALGNQVKAVFTRVSSTLNTAMASH